MRNLAYTCTEEEVEAHFSKYGPLSEVHLPLDKNTHKTIGIGFVTFLIPEHAVKAFSELDGHIFQGRLLHLLPAKAKKTNEEEETGTTRMISQREKRFYFIKNKFSFSNKIGEYLVYQISFCRNQNQF